MKIWTCSILIIGSVFSAAQARVGDTEQEVEARYGSPIPKDDPIFGSEEIAALLAMPADSGVVAALDFEVAKAEWITSPYEAKVSKLLRADPLGRKISSEVLDLAKAKFKKITGAFEPRVYMYNETLIQVVYLHLAGGAAISISEQYLAFSEERADSSESKPEPVAATNKMQEWFKLGDFSYRITGAKVSKSVVGANDLANQLASAVQDMVALDLNKQAKLAGVDIGLTESSERFVIVEYDIRNEATTPAVVLTDDFRLQDGKGRQFSPDGEVTKVLIETSDKAVIAEVLQPGIERHCFQGFRVPANAVAGRLSLVVPEKGVLGTTSALITINEVRATGNFRVQNIDHDLLLSIMGKALERKTLPEPLRGFAHEAESGYYDYMNRKFGTDFASDVPLVFEDYRRSRVYLNLTGKTDVDKDESGWMFDPLYQRTEFGPLMTVSQAAKKIRETLQQAEADTVKLKKTDGF